MSQTTDNAASSVPNVNETKTDDSRFDMISTKTMDTVHATEHNDAPITAKQKVTTQTANAESPAVNDESKRDEGGNGMTLTDSHQSTWTERGTMH